MEFYKKFLITNKLFQLCFSRLPLYLLGQVAGLLSFLIFTPSQQWDSYLMDSVYILLCALTVAGCALAWKCKHIIFTDTESHENTDTTRLQVLSLSHLLVSIHFWGTLTLQVTLQSTVSFDNTLSIYLSLFIVSLTAIPTFGSYKWIWRAMMIGLALLPLVQALLQNPADYFPKGLAISAVAGFIFMIGKITFDQTFNLFDKSESQKNELTYFKTVIEAVPGLVTIFDKDLRYQLINSKLLAFTGLKEEQIVGQQIGFTNRNEFTNLVWEFNKSEKPYFQTKIQMKSVDGPIWLLVTMSRLDRNSQIAVISIDIDQQVKFELEARDQQALAENASRMASIGELAAGIAHEINNPLAIITSKAEQALRKLSRNATENINPDLEKIRDTGFRIAKIVKGLKSLSRSGEKDPFVEFRIAEVIQDIASVFESKLKVHQCQLNLNVSSDLICKGIPTQIGQVIMNLVSNALDAVSESSERWIEISAEDANNGFLEIAVTDSGPGIPDHVKQKIMTPFFTTKAAGVGTGLGLSISKRIAADHGGEFILDQKSARTRFVLRLPKSQEDRLVA